MIKKFVKMLRLIKRSAYVIYEWPLSLKSGETIHNIKFNSEVADVMANRRVVIMAFREKLAAFDACNLEPKFTVTTCYPSPGVHVNPIALGERWLAYADQQFVPIHRY